MKKLYGTHNFSKWIPGSEEIRLSRAAELLQESLCPHLLKVYKWHGGIWFPSTSSGEHKPSRVVRWGLRTAAASRRATSPAGQRSPGAADRWATGSQSSSKSDRQKRKDQRLYLRRPLTHVTAQEGCECNTSHLPEWEHFIRLVSGIDNLSVKSQTPSHKSSLQPHICDVWIIIIHLSDNFYVGTSNLTPDFFFFFKLRMLLFLFK